MRGNFLDIPTDCPQRDERLGWTGDIQVFAPTACVPLRLRRLPRPPGWPIWPPSSTTPAGVVPFVVPNVPSTSARIPAAAWGDAAVIVPWVLYQRYGDAGILATPVREHARLGRPVAGARGREPAVGPGLPVRRLARPGAPPDDPAAARTDPDLVATAYFARSAELLGRRPPASWAERGRGRATRPSPPRCATRSPREYVTPAGRMASDAADGLRPGPGVRPAARRRAAPARRASGWPRWCATSGYRIGTGFVGTPLICDALCGRRARTTPPTGCSCSATARRGSIR